MWGIMRDEGDLKVGADQFPPHIILAAFSIDAFPHKVDFINHNLPWWKQTGGKEHKSPTKLPLQFKEEDRKDDRIGNVKKRKLNQPQITFSSLLLIVENKQAFLWS